MSKTTIVPALPVSIGKSPRERVASRTRELAVLAGRHPPEVTQADYEQAKQEVTGESLLDRQNEILDDAA